MTTDHTPPAEPSEPDNPAAWALAKHIADHPVSTIQAAFRYLNAPLTIELHEPPADRAALRERIAEALDLLQGTAHHLPFETRQRVIEVVTGAVLPPPVPRADVTAAEVAHALDNATPYPIELDSALCRFMAERLLEMLTIGKRPEHPVWQPEEQPEPGEQPQPQDPAGLRRMADEAQPGTEAACVCGHPTRLHHEDVCLLADCECADSLEISALPEALEAVLTKRYTELGNPFSEMRRREQGPDGWPASRPVGPHHVAEALRDLLRRAADEGSGPRLPNHTVNEEEGPDADEAPQDGARS
ncbi:hypothetical protein MQE23_08620 [Streptomyces sp. HP-A2021]|uniref:hypothetical protein n=1 Tax=Streptomyces sp. HP-A2021 TaxID=2927875 RepID=UPI001FAF6DCD|nr:hypothetical protein [Streptomyces sp. HP-A2021]UOB09115.1 hypothetical protein MQE23_08620 [Streptomyces sp. HP-A2021]